MTAGVTDQHGPGLVAFLRTDLVDGELRNIRKAMLPVVAAVGGGVVPA